MWWWVVVLVVVEVKSLPRSRSRRKCFLPFLQQNRLRCCFSAYVFRYPKQIGFFSAEFAI